MRNRGLQLSIEKMSYDIKKNLKELYNTMATLYERERRADSKKIYSIKRNVDKLESASKHLFAIGLSDRRQKNSSILDKGEVENLYKNATVSLGKLEDKLKLDLKIEKTEIATTKYSNIRNNLGRLKSAQNDLKRLDVTLGISNRDWKEIEKNYE